MTLPFILPSLCLPLPENTRPFKSRRFVAPQSGLSYCLSSLLISGISIQEDTDGHTKALEPGVTFVVAHHMREIIPFLAACLYKDVGLTLLVHCATKDWKKEREAKTLGQLSFRHASVSLVPGLSCPPSGWQRNGCLAVQHG